jgi:hypothetical protein
MKQLKLLSLLCLLLSFPIYAEELTVDIPIVTIPTVTTPTIAAPTAPLSTIEKKPETKQSNLQMLIKQVKSAPNKEKRVLMNQLKIQLKSMNKESRQQAMKELQKSFVKKENHIQQKQHQQANHESCQHANHQPKFRYLRKGPKDGTGPHREQGSGGHQGSGQK